MTTSPEDTMPTVSDFDLTQHKPFAEATSKLAELQSQRSTARTEAAAREAEAKETDKAFEDAEVAAALGEERGSFKAVKARAESSREAAFEAKRRCHVLDRAVAEQQARVDAMRSEAEEQIGQRARKLHEAAVRRMDEALAQLNAAQEDEVAVREALEVAFRVRGQPRRRSVHTFAPDVSMNERVGRASDANSTYAGWRKVAGRAGYVLEDR